MEFGLAGVWLFHKVGMLGMFKQSDPPFQIAYIENIDRERKQFLISYFTYFDQPYSVQADGRDLVPAYAKNVVNKLMNNYLFTKNVCGFPMVTFQTTPKLISYSTKKQCGFRLKVKPLCAVSH